MTVGERLTVNDVRAAGFCARGMKTWFDARGLDFRTFLKEGMAIEDAAALNDALAERVIARRRASRGI